MTTQKVFKDVLYGYIQISPLALSIIDKPQFQRLRQLKQLGIANYVFPSATHTRFEHSVGTYHLAGKLLNQIRIRQPELGVSDRMVELVQCAALLHDVGHVAFSHLFDHCLADLLDVPHHEERSVWIIRDMVETHPDIKLDSNEVDLICSLIIGKRPESSTIPAFLFEIVSNTGYHLDVDKCDYLVRDAHHIGISSPLQIDRIFSFARVIGQGSNSHICYHKKVYLQVLDVFMSRYRLHKEVYRHHAVLGIELQVVKILKILSDIMDWKQLFMDNRWIYITDSVLDMIPLMTGGVDDLGSSDKSSSIDKVKELFLNLQTRKFYKRVSGKDETESNSTTVKSVLGFTSSATNPMDSILFYESDLVPHTIKPNDISKLLSNICVEVEECVYKSF